MDPKQNLGENPAATIADAAMSGAIPVVATTDLNASDVTPEPPMSAPALDENPLGAPVLDTAALEAAAAAEAPVEAADVPSDNGEKPAEEAPAEGAEA